MLVLDDCTSALDPATERRVLDGLERRPGQAVLHITQKVRAARTADRILGLEEGRQVGLGHSPEPAGHLPHLPGNLGLSGPGRGGRRWHTVKRPAALCCLPQRRSLQQRFGPHARARDGRGTVPAAPGPLRPLGQGAAAGGVPYPALHRGGPGGTLSAGTGGGLLSALGRRGACRSVSAAAHSGRGRGGTVARQLGPTPAGWRSFPSGWWPASGGSALPSWGGCPCPTLTATPMGIP